MTDKEFEIFKIVLAIVVTFMVSIFLPKRVLIVIRNLVHYYFIAMWRYFYLSLFNIVLLVIYLLYSVNSPSINAYNFIVIPLYLIFTFSLLVLYSLYIEIAKKTPGNKIAIAGCYTVDKDNFLNIDTDAEYLADILNEVSDEFSKKHFSFHSGLFNLYKQSIPKFIPPLLGISKTRKLFKWIIERKGLYNLLYIVRNIGGKNLQYVLMPYKEKFNYIDTEITNFFGLISNANDIDYANSIKAVCIFYLLLNGQSLLDVHLDLKNYVNARKILLSSRELLNSCYNIIEITSLKDNLSVNETKKRWQAHFEMYSGWISYYEEDIDDSLKHFLSALKYNLYFPYGSYEEFKLEYTKHEIFWISKNMEYTSKDLPDSEGQRDEIRQVSIETQERMLESFKYRIPLIVNNIREILCEKCDRFVVKDFQKAFDELERLYPNNAIIYLYKYVFYKFLPLGKDKYNSLFVARIPECKGYIEKCIELDPNFGIAYSKLGGLLGTESFIRKDEDILKIGLEYFDKAKYIYKEMGIDFDYSNKIQNKFHSDNKGELFDLIMKGKTGIDYSKREPIYKDKKINESELLFCEQYKDGKLIGVSNIFWIAPAGGYLTVMIHLNAPIGAEKVKLRISKEMDGNEATNYTLTFNVQPDWSYIHFDKIPFKNSGLYNVTLLKNEVAVVSSNVEIKIVKL